MGLLAKAEAYLQLEAEQRIAAERKMAQEQLLLEAAAKKRYAKIKTTVQHVATEIKTVRNNAQTKLTHLASDFPGKFKTVIKKAYQPKLRRYAAMVLALGLGLQTADPRNMDTRNLVYKHSIDWLTIPGVEATVKEQPAQSDPDVLIDIFKDIKQFKLSEEDRIILAKVLSGEAGPSIEDKIEVLHTIDNRVASPLFPNTFHDVITAENQYKGFEPNNLVTDENLKLIDWYYSQKTKTTIKQPIPNCNRYYFVTGIKNICNKFEISSEGSQGRWVSFANKNYDKPGHYCPTAMHQAEQYRCYCKTKQGQMTEFIHNR